MRPAVGEVLEIVDAEIGEQAAGDAPALALDLGVPERDLGARRAHDVGEERALEARIDRHRDGARAQDPEVGDRPRGLVQPGEDDAIAGAHAHRGEARGGGDRALAPLAEADAGEPLVGEALERDGVIVALGHLVERVEERVVGPQRLGLALEALLDQRVDPLLEAGQMHLPHPLAPVDLLGLPVEARALLEGHAIHRRAGVGAGEDPVGLGDEGHEDLEDVRRAILGLGRALQRLGRRLQDRSHRPDRGLVEEAAEPAHRAGDLARAVALVLLLERPIDSTRLDTRSKSLVFFPSKTCRRL